MKYWILTGGFTNFLCKSCSKIGHIDGKVVRKREKMSNLQNQMQEMREKYKDWYMFNTDIIAVSNVKFISLIAKTSIVMGVLLIFSNRKNQKLSTIGLL